MDRYPVPGQTAIGRRNFLKGAGFVVLGGVAAPLLQACATAATTAPATTGAPAVSVPPSTTSSPSAAALSGTLLELHAGDITATYNAATKKVYDEFTAQNPGVKLDIRSLPFGADWDRLSRETIASGESVDMVHINGQFVWAWARDGLLADLGNDPGMAPVLDRIPKKFYLGGPGETAVRAFPMASAGGVHTNGLYYNKAMLDQAGLKPPATIDDLKAMVAPLGKLGAAPLVHPSGDTFQNPLLMMWVLPQIAGRSGDPLDFVIKTMKGEIRYDSPEWVEAFQTIDDLRSSGVLLAGSGAVDGPAMEQLVFKGKAAMTYNGSWAANDLIKGTATVPYEVHVQTLPLLPGAKTAYHIMAWQGYGLPAKVNSGREIVHAFLKFLSEPAADKEITATNQSFSPIEASNDVITGVYKEFGSLFTDLIPPLDWLWEPEVTTEIGNQLQALVKGSTKAKAVAEAVQTVADGLHTSGRSFFK